MPAATTNKPSEEALPQGGGAFFLFDTPLGRCALVWRGAAIAGAALPEGDDQAMRRNLARRYPGAVEAEAPAFVHDLALRIARHLAGEPEDFSDVAFDLGSASRFEQGVWSAALAIPCGETRTYGELARTLGQPQGAQAVGLALGRNPVPILVPCHRIVAGGGRSGGFSAPGGVAIKFRILQIEGARLPAEGTGLFDALPLAVKPV